MATIGVGFRLQKDIIMNFFHRQIASEFSLIRVGLLSMVLGFSFLADAQSVLPDGQPRIQSGTIEKTREDDGYITISGWDYGFSGEITRVSYKGDEVGVEILAAGFIIRYTLDRNNILLTVEIVGPQNLMADLGDN